MRRIRFFLFGLICLFSFSIVFADNEITIDSMIPEYDENSGVIVNEENGIHSVVFNDKDQNVKYNVVLKNNTDKDIPIDNLSLPTPTEDFLKYELTGLNSGDILKANSTKDIVISLKTIKTEGWGRNFDIDLTTAVNLDSSVLNPNTSDFVVISFIIALLFTVSLVILKNKKVAQYSAVLITFFSVGPYIKAKEELVIPIKIKVSYESQNVMKASKCDIDDEWGTSGCVDYWKYNYLIKNIYIQNEFNEMSEYKYKFDVSEAQNGKVIAYLVINKDDENYYDLYLQADGIMVANQDASSYFSNMYDLESINNLNGLDTSNVTDMRGMFAYAGYNSKNIILDLNKFDTRNVTDMSGMFYFTGHLSKTFLLDLSNFDTSRVVDMSWMFYETGYYSSKLTIELSSFDTSNVKSMRNMFYCTGHSSESFTLDISNFDTSNVTNMSGMFADAGYSNPNFTLDVSNFDTSNVTDMSYMFNGVGYSNPNFVLDLSNFNTSNVIDMNRMFSETGLNSTRLTLNLSSFDTSNVTNMSGMFDETGYNSTNFILDVSNFDTSKVTDMSEMFSHTGYNSLIFSLDVSGFDTSNVTNIRNMFYETGYNSSKLNTSITIKNPNVKSYSYMFYGTAIEPSSKITVNYTSETSDLVDKMIATKSSNSNVVKGVQVD